MEEISNSSSNKIINDTTVLRTLRKSQTFIGNTKNLFEILNTDKKAFKKKIYYNNYKIKLNILENLKDKKIFEEINYLLPCELKINDIYEKGFLQIKKNTLIVLRNKGEDTQNNCISDLGTEKIIDFKKYNNSTMNTEASTNVSISLNKNPRNNNILLFLNFDLITSKLIIHKTKQKFRLLILGKEKNNNKQISVHRIIKFKMPTCEKEIFNNICRNINNIILSSIGYKENIINLSLHKYFINNYFINCNDFYKIAKTGDLILFRSYSCCSKCQRCLTQGEYDHIGLLIKYYHELYVYETTGKDGVVVRKWYEFIYYYWFLLCEKMTYRKLLATQEAMKKFIINNNNETMPNIGKKTSNYSSGFSDSNLDLMSKTEIEKQFYFLLGMKVDSFVQKAQGKKYFFSICEYICNRFYKNKKTNNLKNKGYFCSELIAAVYNYCEIISNKMNISNYLPSSFAENGDAMFNEGFSLGPENIIIFS